MKKFLTLLLCVTMVVSMLVAPASAANASFSSTLETFDSQENYLAANAYIAGEFINCGFNVDASGNAKTSGNIMHYENAIGGKSTVDYSQVLRISGDTTAITDVTAYPATKDVTNAMYYMTLHGGSASSKTSLNDGRVYEFSAYLSGDVKLFFQNSGSNTHACNFTISSADYSDEWINVAIWLPTSDATEYYVYINGELYFSKSTTASNKVWRIRMLPWITADKTDASAFFAIDNLKLTTGLTSYTPAAQPAVEVVGDNFAYAQNMLSAAAGSTAADLAEELTVASGYTVDVYDGTYVDAANGKGPDVTFANQKTGDTALAVGDVIVVHNADFTNVRYIDVVDSDTIKEAIEAANLIKYVDYENNETLTIGNGADSAALEYKDGLYGKASDDTALVLVPNEAPNPRLGITGIEGLNIDSSWRNADYEASTVTIELSVAVDDAYGDFVLSMISKYKDAGKEIDDSVANNANRLNNEFLRVTDGKLVISSQAPGYAYDYTAEQWFRVAVTIKPDTEKYDLYINGVLARENGPLGSDNVVNWITGGAVPETWDGTATDDWQYCGLNEFRIMGYTTSGEASEIAVDDLKVYYGEYSADDKITVSDYTVDCDNVFVLDDGVTLTKAMVEDAVNEGCTVAEYGDGFIVSKGFVKRYFTGAPKSIIVNDGDIKLYDADGELSAITAGARIYAKATPEYVGYKPVLILAVYEGDELKAVRLATGAGSEIKTDAYAVADDAAVENITVKAMLWDGFENIKPYAESVAVPAN